MKPNRAMGSRELVIRAIILVEPLVHTWQHWDWNPTVWIQLICCVEIIDNLLVWLNTSPYEVREKSSVTRLGDFLHFGQPFKAFGNN